MRILTKCIHPFITQLKTQNNSITPRVSSCHFFNHVVVHFFSLLSKSVMCVYHNTFIHNTHPPIDRNVSCVIWGYYEENYNEYSC